MRIKHLLLDIVTYFLFIAAAAILKNFYLSWSISWDLAIAAFNNSYIYIPLVIFATYDITLFLWLKFGKDKKKNQLKYNELFDNTTTRIVFASLAAISFLIFDALK